MNILQDKTIGVSISESDELGFLGLGKAHLEDVNLEIARYLLAQGCTYAYGGDWRPQGFTHHLSELANSYFPFDDEKKRIINFLGFPVGDGLTIETESKYSHVVEFLKMGRPNILPDMKTDSVESRLVWFNSMTEMRQAMTTKIDARIVLGGKISKFMGKYPGIIEEAYLTMKSEKPIYLCGGFGGATAVIIEALLNKPSEKWNLNYYSNDTTYLNTVNHFNQNQSGESVDYQKIFDFFQSKGVNELKNGLTVSENERLFHTIHIPEIIALILKGLSILFKDNSKNIS
jgi:hypothetical protein